MIGLATRLGSLVTSPTAPSCWTARPPGQPPSDGRRGGVWSLAIRHSPSCSPPRTHRLASLASRARRTAPPRRRPAGVGLARGQPGAPRCSPALWDEGCEWFDPAPEPYLPPSGPDVFA